MTRRARWCVLALLVALPPAALAQKTTAPWDENRRQGIVHLELSLDPQPPLIGTGAIVRTAADRYFVVTATHNLFPTVAPGQVPRTDQCLPLSKDLKLRRANSGGPQMEPLCVRHLRWDISVITLKPPAVPYPSVTLAPRPVKRGMSVFIAGFPLGKLDYSRSGRVTSTDDKDGTGIADIVTATGYSGAPYADADGAVIGFHTGRAVGAVTGYTVVVPVTVIQRDLEDALGVSLHQLQVHGAPMPTPPKPPAGIQDIPVTP